MTITCTATGSTAGNPNTITLTPTDSVAGAAYANEQVFLFKSPITNNNPVTVAYNGLTAQTANKETSTGQVALIANDLISGNWYYGLYDSGATHIVITPFTSPAVSGGSYVPLSSAPFIPRVYPINNPLGYASGGLNSGWPVSEGGGVPTGGHSLQWIDGNNYEQAEIRQLISDDPSCIYVHTITNAANNGSGLIRLTITPAITALETSAGFVTGGFASVGLVVGTTEANGNWTITVVDSTHIDLQASTFTHAYTSGGQISAGPLDLAPYFAATRCVPNRLPLFLDAVGAMQYAGQTTQHYNSGPQPYAASIAIVMDPSETQTNAQGALVFGVASNYGSVRQYISSIAVMQGLVGLAPGYELPGQAIGNQANFQAADKGWQTVNMGVGYFVAGAPIGQDASYSNLVITNNATTPNTKIDISADSIGLFGPTAAATGGKISLSTSTSIKGGSHTIDCGTTGANGLDTGSLAANTWYAVWWIYNPSTGVDAGLVSLSGTSPTMPSGYTFKRRSGWKLTDGSGHFYRTKQQGNKAAYTLIASSNTTSLPTFDSGIQGNPGSSVSWHSSAWSKAVPSTASYAFVVLDATGGTNTSIAIAAPNNQYAGFGMTGGAPLQLYINIAGGSVMGELPIEGSNVYYASNLASCALQCLSYTDNL